MKILVLPTAAAAAAAASEIARARGAMVGRGVMSLDRVVMGLGQWGVEAAGRQLIDPLAGMMLVRAMAGEEGAGGSWRGAGGVWRMLMELRAGGGGAELVGSIAPELRMLLKGYEQALEEGGLEDHGGGCQRAVQLLAEGQRPQWLKGVEELEVRGVVWLRAMDTVVLRALGGVMKVRVVFAPQPPEGALGAYRRLIQSTLRALTPAVEVVLPRLKDQGPLGVVAERAALGQVGDREESLRLIRAGGMYTEAELIVEYVLEALRQGWEEGEVVVCLPGLELSGQMIVDAARRRSVAIGLEGAGIEYEGLIQSVLDLARVVVEGWQGRVLERIFASPYIRTGLQRLGGVELSPDASLRLAKSGYVREAGVDPVQWLAQSAQPELARACEQLKKLVEPLGQPHTPAAYARAMRSVVKLLGIREQVLRLGGEVAARELVELSKLERALSAMEEAGGQARAGTMSPRTLLGLVREALRRQGSGSGRSGIGVRVVSIPEALGLEAKVVVVGGVHQGGFPRMPPPLGMLTARQQRLVGRRVGVVIWRTQAEEYAGQVARVLALVAKAKQVMVCFPGADPQGRPLAPAGLFLQLARASGGEVQDWGEGVYGVVPSLSGARHHGEIWAGAARELLRCGGEEGELAQAAVWHLCRDEQARMRWQAIASRVLAPGVRGSVKGAKARLWWKGMVQARATKGLTPTELEKLKGCPFRWVVENLLGVEQWPREGWELGAKVEGNLVHRVLAWVFDPQRPLPDPQHLPQTIAQMLEQAVAELGSGGVHPVVLARRLKRLKQWLRVIVGEELERMKTRGSRVIGVERDVQLELKELGVMIRGRVDRLEQAGDELLITDYKHSTPDNLPQINPHKWEEKGLFQLWIYAAAVASQFPAKAVRLQYVSTRAPLLPPRESFALSTDDELLGEGLARAVMEIWREVVEGAVPARGASEHCRRCGFRSWCEEGTR